MSFRTCDHLKEDGVYCDSAALSGKNFCYFHLNVRGRCLKMARALARSDACRIQLPVIAAATPRQRFQSDWAGCCQPGGRVGALKMSLQLQTAQCLTNKWLWNEYFAHETMRNSLIPKTRGGRGYP